MNPWRQLREKGILMSEFFGNLAPQAEKDRQRHQVEVALRINALLLPWDVKVEIWQEELAQSETTFCRVLERCGYTPASEPLG